MADEPRWHNLVEPPRLIEHFLAHPPQGFRAWTMDDGTPAFSALLDPLLTADDSVQRCVNAVPGSRLWRRWLRMSTCFVGTTVSEYGLLPRGTGAPAFAHRLLAGATGEEPRRHRLLVVKDLPVASPLLDPASNAHAAEVGEALRRAGFALLAGQALAWVPIDFESSDEYLSRLSASRRKDLRRKLRSRRSLDIEMLPTGAAALHDRELQRRIYRLYRNVYDQSKLQFDLLTPAFFEGILQDAGADGRVFLYRHEGRLIGFNLCFVAQGALVDKYIGFEYPHARRHNLYCVSWIHNLEYAASCGLARFIAGWTDPEVKSQLGARFTFTRHAVYPRNPVLRAALVRFAGRFESDQQWFDRRARAAHRP